VKITIDLKILNYNKKKDLKKTNIGLIYYLLFLKDDFGKLNHKTTSHQN
jgi:hypothetical protein